MVAEDTIWSHLQYDIQEKERVLGQKEVNSNATFTAY